MRSCIRTGLRGRFFNSVDLVNRLEAEARAGRERRLADYFTRLDFIVLDELGYLPFAQAGGQLGWDGKAGSPAEPESLVGGVAIGTTRNNACSVGSVLDADPLDRWVNFQRRCQRKVKMSSV